MTTEMWTAIGAASDAMLAAGAIYVTQFHLRAHIEDRRQEKAINPDIKNKHKGHAETLRKYASLSDPIKLAIILVATLAKLAASLVKMY
jgi:hypothetical protein